MTNRVVALHVAEEVINDGRVLHLTKAPVALAELAPKQSALAVHVPAQTYESDNDSVYHTEAK